MKQRLSALCVHLPLAKIVITLSPIVAIHHRISPSLDWCHEVLSSIEGAMKTRRTCLLCCSSFTLIDLVILSRTIGRGPSHLIRELMVSLPPICSQCTRAAQKKASCQITSRIFLVFRCYDWTIILRVAIFHYWGITFNFLGIPVVRPGPLK